MKTTTAAEPAAPPGGRRRVTRWQPIWFIVALQAAAPLNGMEASLWQGETIRFAVLLQIYVGACLAGWVITDSIRRQHPYPLLSRDWLTMFFYLLAPLYLIQTQRLWGVLKLILNIVLWIVLTGVGAALMWQIQQNLSPEFWPR